MRYFTVKYVKKPSGQVDESLAVTNNLKNHDIQECSVIVDFKKRQVVKASLEGNTVQKDFDRVVGFYHTHYQHIIDRLLKENGLEDTQAKETAKASASNPETVDDTAAQPAVETAAESNVSTSSSSDTTQVSSE